MFGYYALTSKQEMFGFHTTDLQAGDCEEFEKPSLDRVKRDAAGCYLLVSKQEITKSSVNKLIVYFRLLELVSLSSITTIHLNVKQQNTKKTFT